MAPRGAAASAPWSGGGVSLTFATLLLLFNKSQRKSHYFFSPPTSIIINVSMLISNERMTLILLFWTVRKYQALKAWKTVKSYSVKVHCDATLLITVYIWLSIHYLCKPLCPASLFCVVQCFCPLSKNLANVKPFLCRLLCVCHHDAGGNINSCHYCIFQYIDSMTIKAT